MSKIVIFALLICFLLAGTALADTTNSADVSSEKPVLTIYPYTIGQLPPTFYGETNLPVGENLMINITKFPVSTQSESAVISVLSADADTKPSFTPEIKGMNKWLYTGNIQNYTFGDYQAIISAVNENLSDQNIFAIKTPLNSIDD
jgi:hypothetical protein